MKQEIDIWGIHRGRSGEATNLFLERGVVALGYPDTGDVTGLNTIEEFKQRFLSSYPYAGLRAAAAGSGNLLRFVHKIKNGDYVVFYSLREKRYYIGRVTGDYSYQPSVDRSYPHQRSVEWVTSVARENCSQSLIKTMGSGLSIFSLNKHREEVQTVLEG